MKENCLNKWKIECSLFNTNEEVNVRFTTNIALRVKGYTYFLCDEKHNGGILIPTALSSLLEILTRE